MGRPSAAKATLTDFELRRAYDQQLAAGAQPEELELVILDGPVDAVTSVDREIAEVPEERSEQAQSLADQLVPSHLRAVNTTPIPQAESIATSATTPGFTSPQIPVAVEVPMSVGTAQSVEPAVDSGGVPVNQDSGLSLDNGHRSKNSRRRSRRRSKQNRFPVPFLVVSLFALVGGVIAILVLNGGNREVANVDKTGEKKGVQKPANIIQLQSAKSSGEATDPEGKKPVISDPVPRDPDTGKNPLKPLPPMFGKPVKPKPEEK